MDDQTPPPGTDFGPRFLAPVGILVAVVLITSAARFYTRVHPRNLLKWDDYTYMFAGAEVRSKDRYGQTPLSWAAERGHESIVRLLESSLILADACMPSADHSLRSATGLTAAEFLVRPPDVPRSPVSGNVYRYKACLDVAGVNSCMAEICAVYLMLTDKASGGPLSDREEAGDMMDIGDEGFGDDVSTLEETSSLTVGKSGKGRALFDYAAKHWGTHYCLADISSFASDLGHENHALFDKAIALCDTSTSTFRAWFQLFWDTISTTPRFPDGLTPLMVASQLGLPDIMRVLLLSGDEGRKTDALMVSKPTQARTSHVRDADSEGWTALHWAVWNGHGIHVNDATMTLLLEQHHDDEDDDDGNESSSDHESRARTKTRVFDIRDKKGLTPLHWAAADGQEDAMRHLLKAGAIVDAFDAGGMTPLALAVETQFLGAVDLLLEYGADVNAATVTSGHQSKGTVINGIGNGYDREQIVIEQREEEEEDYDEEDDDEEDDDEEDDDEEDDDEEDDDEEDDDEEDDEEDEDEEERE